MKVAVGSQNPVKIAAVKKAFASYFPGKKIEYIGLATDSGVSEQPLSVKEAIAGAVNRAKHSASKAADFAVGIEGGLSFHTVGGREYGVEISWACVYDCRTGLSEVASTSGGPIFPRVLKHIHKDQTLSEAMAKAYGLVNLGQQNGYIGWLSDDVITRESNNFEAVFLALSALLHEENHDT